MESAADKRARAQRDMAAAVKARRDLAAKRAKEYRDRRRVEAAAVDAAPIAPPVEAAPRMERPAPVVEAPPEVARLEPDDLAAPPADVLAAELPPEVAAAAAAAPPVELPPEPIAAALPPTPDALALGETVKIAVAWCCAQAVTRHAMPPMVAGAFTSGLLAAMTGQAATELAMKYNFKKPPPELVFATGVGISVWGAFGPPTVLPGAKKPDPAAGDAPAAPPEGVGAPEAQAIPAAPWAGGAA